MNIGEATAAVTVLRALQAQPPLPGLDSESACLAAARLAQGAGKALQLAPQAFVPQAWLDQARPGTRRS